LPVATFSRYQDIARTMGQPDKVVFESEIARAGKFRCPVADSSFRDSGPTENFLVVFPRTSVWLRYSGSREFVADPTISTIYNRGQEYTRAELSGEGDRCEWFGVSLAVALDISSTFDPAARDRNERPFAREYAPIDSELYLAQRRFFLRLARGAINRLEAEETIIALVTAVLRRAYDHRLPQERPRATDAHRDLVQRARASLLRSVDGNTGLSLIAAELGVSEFHLCRVFREQTGLTLHEFRREVRLRTALERLEDPNADLSRIALDLGFSSHSHFSDVLRRTFGRTPTSVRHSLTS
jgi:AraC-like DNA-binding protein